jgi:beta-lactamase class A
LAAAGASRRWALIAGFVFVPATLALIVGIMLNREEAEAVAVQPATVTAPPAAPQGPAPPTALANQIATLGQSFEGSTGIAVLSIDDGWIAGHRADRIFPQQSVSKLWVAATVLDRVDRGELSLSDNITLTPADLTIFHQPVRKYIVAQGRYTTTVAELMRYAMTQSDNTANDALYRRVGGQAGVTEFLTRKSLGQIAMSTGEKALQADIAGLEWDPAFSYGRIFWQVRNRLPPKVRVEALSRYLADPPDGASPEAIVRALAKLHRQELLSPPSSAYLIELMNQSKTGPDRLRGGIAENSGWQMAHKTGTGQVLGSFATAYNDVGILTSPSGRSYAVAVMIGSTSQSVKARQELMQTVTREVIALESSAPLPAGMR